ncbi:MAG: 6-phosphofructokinase [Porticoccus sp.]|nr:6-phosphofructokinase [Porticoccus sp.]
MHKSTIEKKNVFYAQSGGVTAVINATACGLIEATREHSDKIGNVYAGYNGILGALREELIDTSKESDDAIASLRYTPSGAFGSCRYKLKNFEDSKAEYKRLIQVFKAHNIGYFFYNGGGDSADTCLKVSQISKQMGYPIQAIHIPKTVDNDLPFTDNCPGFGSVAKYIAVSTKEASLDIASMCETSTKVFILEVMGRHAGWIAAASALAAEKAGDPPHIILFPEVPFSGQSFLDKVEKTVLREGYCVVVASEGTKYLDGKFISGSTNKDAFGHHQLGGLAPTLANMIKSSLGYKYHWALADYLQRSARHIASATDVAQAYAVGRTAVEYALAGKNSVMVTIERKEGNIYSWDLGEAELADIANQEKKMPKNFITADGFGVTKEGINYLSPLIQGEDYPPYKNGIPIYKKLDNNFVKKKLKESFKV